MLTTRSVCRGSLFLSGFLAWQSSIHRNGNEMSVATNGHGESPFSIYRNVLDFVMSRLSLDEGAAIEVILNELCYVSDWIDLCTQTADEEIKGSCVNQRAKDWSQAWLN